MMFVYTFMLFVDTLFSRFISLQDQSQVSVSDGSKTEMAGGWRAG